MRRIWKEVNRQGFDGHEWHPAKGIGLGPAQIHEGLHGRFSIAGDVDEPLDGRCRS